MNIEELLKPRYKVIADWPKQHFYNVGEVIEMKLISNGTYWDGEESYYLTEKEIQNYPHLFKALEWWEDRKESDMPQYVSYKLLEGSTPKILKVEKHFYSSFGDYNSKVFMSGGYFHSYSKSFPITKEEYESQK